MSHYSKFCIDKNVASKIVSLTSYSISIASLANPMSYMLHLVKITVPHSSDTVNICLGHHREATIMYSTNIIFQTDERQQLSFSLLKSIPSVQQSQT